MRLHRGLKIYDNDWFLKYGLSADAAADLLAAWNITYVIAQSSFLPMQDSAVASAVSASDAARYAALDDRAFRAALGERGIAYFACLNIGFDPRLVAARPDLRPIDQFGRTAVIEDWYIGLPPDRQGNLAHKIGLLKRAVIALRPDVVHLGFMRWPGFWETWLPNDRRADKPEYCYSAQTLGQFRDAAGIDLPTDDPRAAAQLIARHHRGAWTRWKCGATVAAIRRVRGELEPLMPGLRISINTLPLLPSDFDNAVAEVFGQDIERLREVVDIFEVMAYHQIMARPTQWPAAVAGDIRRRSGQATICTVQAKALYLDGMHQGRGRAPDLTARDFRLTLDALEPSPVDGVCVFTFSDLLALRGSARGEAMIERLRRFRD